MRTKVYLYLSKLTPVQFQKFDRFVHSPYLSRHAETIRFFELIHPFYPQFEDSLLQSQDLFTAIYPGETFDDNKIRTLRKYLFQLFGRFMVMERLAFNDPQWAVWEAEALLDAGEIPLFERKLKKAQSQLNESPLRDADFYLSTFKLQKASLTFEMEHRSRFEAKSFSELLGSLNHYFLAEHLKYACTASYLSLTTSIAPEEMPLLETVMDFCKKNLLQLPPVVSMYYRVLCLLSEEPFEEHYERLKTDLLAHADSLPADDQTTLFNYLVNYANLRYRKGNIEMLEEMLGLYQAMLNRNALQQGGQLSTHHYKNLVTLGLRLGKYDWTEAFILRYKVELDPEFAEGVFNYNMAHLYFYQAEYRKALRLLQQVEFIDPYYRISYNLLLFKIYYECNETEPLYSLIQAFRNYLNRQAELSEAQRASYLNFIRFTRALYGIKSGKKHRIAHVDAQIRQANALIEKEWLLKKLADFGGDAAENA